MSREIKFRAWDKDHNHMNKWNQVRQWSFKSYEDDNIQLLQYTGHKDEEGNEIYEGDIWELSQGNNSRLTPDVDKYMVEWIDHMGAFGLAFYWEGEKDHYDMSVSGLGKVVGNKFEYKKYQQYCKDNSIK